jgi:hypothetical protein
MDDILLRVSALLVEIEVGEDVKVSRNFVCANGHVLGVAVQVKVEEEWDGKKHTFYVDRLLKFRRAVDREAERPAEIEVDCMIEGTTYDITCDVPGCPHKRTWWMGEAALERLKEKVGGRNE